MMMNLDAATQEAAELGKANPLRDADKDLSDKLKPEHKSSEGESSTGFIWTDIKSRKKVFFSYVSLLNLPTIVREYQLKGLEVVYFATGLIFSSFEGAVQIYRTTRSVDEVKDFLTPSLQEQEKSKYRLGKN